ncbi:unnamed protein product [Notodromas monacha]|uniref:Uncharacterized protein n=1 Tax=Notodromas monacha TaxID=399045 RepID=A0A7R9BQC9_9CRUS|nr:unnamed protein product [Notodromas monacha]CAG0918632.1 unnamed protein product [Notodromas monacha]
MEVHASLLSLVKAIVDTSKTDEEILEYQEIASNIIDQIIPLPEGATAVTAPHLGYNALMLACQYGRHKVVKALLDKRADPTIKCENPVPGASALHCAASNGHPECLGLLLKKIESLEVRESILNAQKTKCGNTALHDAVGGAQVWVPSCSRFEKCVELLIRQPKINLDIPNNANGDTALHLAARSGNHTTVSQLLVFGANASLPNKNKICVGPQLLSVSPEMFKLALDSCITLSDKKLYDPALEMHMDFEILIPKEGNETALLEKIAGKRDSDSIICHPLVEAFIQMEWHVCKTRRWLYIFVMTLILLALLLRVGYLMMKSSIAGCE